VEHGVEPLWKGLPKPAPPEGVEDGAADELLAGVGATEDVVGASVEVELVVEVAEVVDWLS
jgi:hypothetical protein